MSININIHVSRARHDSSAIKAAPGRTEGGALYLNFTDKPENRPFEITIYTGSIALADALAEAINGVMERFAKPALSEAAKEAAR